MTPFYSLILRHLWFGVKYFNFWYLFPVKKGTLDWKGSFSHNIELATIKRLQTTSTNPFPQGIQLIVPTIGCFHPDSAFYTFQQIPTNP